MTTIITLDEYQRAAERTAAMSEDWKFRRMVFGLGIAGEAGEVADLIKKEQGHGHPEDRGKMQKELGDVLWYLAMVAQEYGLLLSDVAQANVTKLEARYPAGFTTERSMNRAPDGS